MPQRLIAQVAYKSPITLQTALIRIRHEKQTYFIGASIGGENDETGYAWIANAATEQQARDIGNTWHKRLTQVYGMRKVGI